MKKPDIFLYFVFGIILITFTVYLIKPLNNFPSPPQNAVQSNELADTETPLRRAYFTNLSREEVINHYQNYFSNSLRLNYPPEEAQGIIRDQTRSTYLEELAYPLRESIYINGFEPTLAKDTILIDGENFRQKIIIRHVPNDTLVRTILGVAGLLILFLIIKEYLKEIRQWIH